MSNAGLRLTLPEARHSAQRNSPQKRLSVALPCAALLCLALLIALPGTRHAAMALMNRLYAASEALNHYRYTRFDVAEGQSVVTALLLLGIAALCWGLWLICIRVKWPVLLTAALVAGVQAYYGLTLPSWANLLLFSALGLLMLRPKELPKIAAFAVLALVCALLTLLLWPQVDTHMEAFSETLRDRLSPAAQELGGGMDWEEPQAVNETRHINRQSLDAGNADARQERDYRLVTVEQEEIARPEWLNWLRIALLLLLVIVLVVLPFLPFVWLNRRRKIALTARAAFGSENRGEAAEAMFRHSVRYLEATGNGAGNRLYRDWEDCLAKALSPDYAQRFHSASLVYEKARYSEQELTEDELAQVSTLLSETERLLYDEAPRRQQLRLKLLECLHE